MDPVQARRIVADFITGEWIHPDLLEPAIGDLSAEETNRLRRDHGAGEYPEMVCDAFQERAAEFLDASPTQRKNEMPQLLDHLDYCRECLDFYWELRTSCWDTDNEGLKGTWTHRLGETIQLQPRTDEHWVESGRGPRAAFQEPQRIAMGPSAVSDSTPSMMRWRFTTPNAEVTIQLTAEGMPDGTVVIRYCLEPSTEETGRVTGGEVLIQRNDIVTPPLISAQFHEYADKPISLKVGEWQLTISITGSQHSDVFQIPLIIRARRPGTDQGETV